MRQGGAALAPREASSIVRGGPVVARRRGCDLGSSEDDRVGAEPKTPTTRRAPPSYEDALLSARRIPPKSPPRPGAEHDGERGPKKPTRAHQPRPIARVPRRTPVDPSIPSSRHSQRERSTTRSGSRSPRACRRGERRRNTSIPSTRAPRLKNGRLGPSRLAPSRRPSPHAAPRATLPPADTRRSA